MEFKFLTKTARLAPLRFKMGNEGVSHWAIVGRLKDRFTQESTCGFTLCTENKESSSDEIVGRAFLLGEGKDAIQTLRLREIEREVAETMNHARPD